MGFGSKKRSQRGGFYLWNQRTRVVYLASRGNLVPTRRLGAKFVTVYGIQRILKLIGLKLQT